MLKLRGGLIQPPSLLSTIPRLLRIADEPGSRLDGLLGSPVRHNRRRSLSREPKVIARISTVRFEPDGLTEECLGLFRSIELQQHEAKVVVCLREVWPEPENLAEAGFRDLGLALLLEECSEVVVDHERVGKQPEGLLEAGGGFLGLA